MRLELCLLIIGSGCSSDSLILIISSLNSHSISFLSLRLNILYLLVLDIGWRKLHTQYDISNLKLSKTCHIHVVLLCIIINNQVLHLNLHLDPFLVSKSRPNVIGLGDNSLIWPHDALGLFDIDMQ